MEREAFINDLIKKKGCLKQSLAAAIGQSKQSFSAKLSGTNRFFREEVEILAKILGDEVFEAFPEYQDRRYDICSGLRMVRVAFLRQSMEELAASLGITKQAWQKYETDRIPPASYIADLAVHYHIPCSVLLNVDEESWKHCTGENLVLKKLEEDPYYLEYAKSGMPYGLHEDKKLALRWVSCLINDLDHYGLQELLECILEVYRKNHTFMQSRVYKRLTETSEQKMVSKPRMAHLLKEEENNGLQE